MFNNNGDNFRGMSGHTTGDREQWPLCVSSHAFYDGVNYLLHSYILAVKDCYLPAVEVFPTPGAP